MPSSPSSVASNTRAQTHKSPTTSDIMKAIASLSTSQSSQFSELKSSISPLTSQVADLVTENASFRAEISVLRSRLDVLESRPVLSSDSLSMILRESTERSKVEFNAIAYGVPESAANTAVLRFKDDLLSLNNHLRQISVPEPTEPKLIRLGNNNARKPRPLKIICRSKAEASQLISNFNSQTRQGLYLSPVFALFVTKPRLNANFYVKLIPSCRAKWMVALLTLPFHTLMVYLQSSKPVQKTPEEEAITVRVLLSIRTSS